MIPKSESTSEKQEDVKLTSEDVGEAGAMKLIQGRYQAVGESEKSWWSKFPTFLKGGKKTLQVISNSKLNTAFSFILNQDKTLRNLLVAASTYGLERLLNAKAFNCPEKNYQQYGFVFLFAPLVILFCANVLVIGEIWKYSSRMFIKRYRRRGDCSVRVLPSLMKCCVGPAVWLIVAFQEKDYYICARLGPLSLSNNETLSKQEIVEKKRKIEQCNSEAQVLAWFVFSGLMIFGAALIVWKKCYFKDNLLMENDYSFERREALSARITFTKLAGGTLCQDADIDDDPMTAEYGSEEDRVTLYHEGVPELIGKKTVEKLFEGYKGADWTSGDKWHYIKVYAAFKEMYPRISTGSPRHPWRAMQGDGKQTSRRAKFLPATSSQETGSTAEMQPLYSYGDDKNIQTSKQGDLTKKKQEEEHGMDRGNGTGSVSLPDKESTGDEFDEFVTEINKYESK